MYFIYKDKSPDAVDVDTENGLVAVSDINVLCEGDNEW